MKALSEAPKQKSGTVRNVKPAHGMTARQRNGHGRGTAKIKRILVPIDFSPMSLKALKYATELADLVGAKIVLEHIVEPLPIVPDFAAYTAAGFQDTAVASAKQQLAQLRKRDARSTELIETTNVRQGVPYLEITRAASTLKADLIVLATHGYSGLTHVLLGSTAERVVRHARCPVVVVPANK